MPGIARKSEATKPAQKRATTAKKKGLRKQAAPTSPFEPKRPKRKKTLKGKKKTPARKKTPKNPFSIESPNAFIERLIKTGRPSEHDLKRLQMLANPSKFLGDSLPTELKNLYLDLTSVRNISKKDFRQSDLFQSSDAADIYTRDFHKRETFTKGDLKAPTREMQYLLQAHWQVLLTFLNVVCKGKAVIPNLNDYPVGLIPLNKKPIAPIKTYERDYKALMTTVIQKALHWHQAAQLLTDSERYHIESGVQDEIKKICTNKLLTARASKWGAPAFPYRLSIKKRLFSPTSTEDYSLDDFRRQAIALCTQARREDLLECVAPTEEELEALTFADVRSGAVEAKSSPVTPTPPMTPKRVSMRSAPLQQTETSEPKRPESPPASPDRTPERGSSNRKAQPDSVSHRQFTVAASTPETDAPYKTPAFLRRINDQFLEKRFPETPNTTPLISAHTPAPFTANPLDASRFRGEAHTPAFGSETSRIIPHPFALDTTVKNLSVEMAAASGEITPSKTASELSELDETTRDEWGLPLLSQPDNKKGETPQRRTPETTRNEAIRDFEANWIRHLKEPLKTPQKKPIKSKIKTPPLPMEHPNGFLKRGVDGAPTAPLTTAWETPGKIKKAPSPISAERIAQALRRAAFLNGWTRKALQAKRVTPPKPKTPIQHWRISPPKPPKRTPVATPESETPVSAPRTPADDLVRSFSAMTPETPRRKIPLTSGNIYFSCQISPAKPQKLTRKPRTTSANSAFGSSVQDDKAPGKLKPLNIVKPNKIVKPKPPAAGEATVSRMEPPTSSPARLDSGRLLPRPISSPASGHASSHSSIESKVPPAEHTAEHKQKDLPAVLPVSITPNPEVLQKKSSAEPKKKGPPPSGSVTVTVNGGHSFSSSRQEEKPKGTRASAANIKPTAPKTPALGTPGTYPITRDVETVTTTTTEYKAKAAPGVGAGAAPGVGAGAAPRRELDLITRPSPARPFRPKNSSTLEKTDAQPRSGPFHPAGKVLSGKPSPARQRGAQGVHKSSSLPSGDGEAKGSGIFPDTLAPSTKTDTKKQQVLFKRAKEESFRQKMLPLQLKQIFFEPLQHLRSKTWGENKNSTLQCLKLNKLSYELTNLEKQINQHYQDQAKSILITNPNLDQETETLSAKYKTFILTESQNFLRNLLTKKSLLNERGDGLNQLPFFNATSTTHKKMEAALEDLNQLISKNTP